MSDRLTQTRIAGMPRLMDVQPTGQRAAVVADVAIKSAAKLDIYSRWLRFHQKHPNIYRSLEGLALYSVRQSPPRRFGVKALWEIARWERRKGFQKEDGEEWLLSNDFTSMYARLLAELHPEFLGDKDKGIEPYFEMRELRASRWPVDEASRAERVPR
jgi:hypothetical protein